MHVSYSYLKFYLAFSLLVHKKYCQSLTVPHLLLQIPCDLCGWYGFLSQSHLSSVLHLQEV